VLVPTTGWTLGGRTAKGRETTDGKSDIPDPMELAMGAACVLVPTEERPCGDRAPVIGKEMKEGDLNNIDTTSLNGDISENTGCLDKAVLISVRATVSIVSRSALMWCLPPSVGSTAAWDWPRSESSRASGPPVRE
jgi:hypothetical protein